MHAEPSSGARDLIFGQILRLLPYFMCANSKDSGETAQMCRLTWAFAGRLCDKYHNLMSWLKYYIIMLAKFEHVGYLMKTLWQELSTKQWSTQNQFHKMKNRQAYDAF